MKKVLQTPLCDKDISGLRIGDIVYLCGTIVTGRDEAHRRIVQEGMDCPVDLAGGVIFHAGPIVRGKNDLVSIGPTSSIRMEKWASGLMEKTGVRMMIGKGGMGEETARGCREHTTVHCVYPGGCAVLGAGQVEKIESVFWPELGMGECLWVLRVRDFGPLIVSIDTLGNNLFAENAKHYESRREAIVSSLDCRI